MKGCIQWTTPSFQPLWDDIDIKTIFPDGDPNEIVFEANGWKLSAVWYRTELVEEKAILIANYRNAATNSVQSFVVHKLHFDGIHYKTFLANMLEFHHIPSNIAKEKRLDLTFPMNTARSFVELQDAHRREREDQMMLIQQLQGYLDFQTEQRAALESKLREERKENDTMWGIASCSFGAVLLVIGYFVVAMRWRAEEEHEEEMQGELIAQSQMIKTPHPLVPVVPSAHAGRLGVHEHPAVRDVFGMKEHWDVTPGEGFHVPRITSDGSTPGRTQGTRKCNVALDVKERDKEGSEGLPKVSEDNWDGTGMELSEEDATTEQGEQLDL